MAVARIIQIARALSDPQRVAILERIARERETPCKALVDEFHITPATISHHVKELVEADLVTVRREGKCAYFTVRSDTVAAFQADIKGLGAARRSGRPARMRASARATLRPARGVSPGKGKGGSGKGREADNLRSPDDCGSAAASAAQGRRSRTSGSR